jgi:quinohemoprotein ethanol dehydrogenase
MSGGVGNGQEWDRAHRSANKGDNLFLSSIVAVNADTGDYVWHFQATPGEEWDYDAVQQLILADLTIGGERRQVLMQANKNGFFYVLDRKTGKLISAKTFVPINWASGIDEKTGRPIENPDIRYSTTGKPVRMMPGPDGAHSWHPMAYNPTTGLVYIPSQEIAKVFTPDPNFKTSAMGWNLGVDVAGTPGEKPGNLIAWDPVNQREVWRVHYRGPWNGGVLTTAGNIVAQGDAAGNFDVYRAGRAMAGDPSTTRICERTRSFSPSKPSVRRLTVIAGSQRGAKVYPKDCDVEAVQTDLGLNVAVAVLSEMAISVRAGWSRHILRHGRRRALQPLPAP